MKKVLAIVMAAVFVWSLSACGEAPSLTADEALTIALEQAGVTRDSIRDLENNLDRENGVLVYEIDFDAGDTEYSYDVDAQTGAVTERERDRVD